MQSLFRCWCLSLFSSRHRSYKEQNGRAQAWRMENERTTIYRVINEGFFFDNVRDDSGCKTGLWPTVARIKSAGSQHAISAVNSGCKAEIPGGHGSRCLGLQSDAEGWAQPRFTFALLFFCRKSSHRKSTRRPRSVQRAQGIIPCFMSSGPNVCLAALVIAWSCFPILSLCSHNSRMAPLSLVTLVIFSGWIDRPPILDTPKWPGGPANCHHLIPLNTGRAAIKNVCLHVIQWPSQNFHLVLGHVLLCLHF